ncbi:MAG: PP2C family protein-serine/threonine phosphatase [Elainellaceae cyanobacterium]
MPKILVIDDDPVVRLVLKKALQEQDCDVIVASDGESGVDKAKQFRPALIICDWMMPGLDGLDVCRHIKCNPHLSTTFFILLTSRTEVEDRVKGLDTGADDFLTKPIEINELRARVRAGLRLYQLNQDLQTQKQILEAELHEAADYVRSILPLPLTGTVSIDSRFIPSSQLGGDCFDYYWLDPDYLVIYLLDVSGHGLGAALPSISILNVLRSQSLPEVSFYQPPAVLKALNETFQMNSQNDKYFTMWYGIFNRVKRQLVYASAGHPPAILVTPEGQKLTFEQLRTPNLPIGMMTDITYKSSCHFIPEGSVLYVFSDGAYEINQNANYYDERGGLEAFIDLLRNQPEHTNLDGILSEIYAFRGQKTLDDDLSLLRVRFD